MEVAKFKPVAGFLIVFKEADESKTASGIITEENTDDFLIHGEVITSSSEIFNEGDDVIFNLVDADSSFRDGAKSYFLVSEKFIRGTYG